MIELSEWVIAFLIVVIASILLGCLTVFSMELISNAYKALIGLSGKALRRYGKTLAQSQRKL
jgi:hypothetical protein